MIGPPLDSADGRRAPAGPSGSGRRGERGGISWVTLVLLAAVVGGGYWLWVWGPVYLENYEVKQTVRDYLNQAIKNPDDELLRHNMVLKIRSLNEREVTDESGRQVRVPSVQLEDRDVSWERDTRSQPRVLRVAFEYTREVEYPGLNRVETKVFVIDLSNDLTVPNWGPPR